MDDAEKQIATARYTLGNALEVMADLGIPDHVIVREMVNLALALVGAQRGGPEGIPDWLEAMARDMRLNNSEPGGRA